MAFRFSLQPLLRVRSVRERAEYFRLLAASAAVVRLREEITALADESSQARMQWSRQLASGAMAAELHFETLLEGKRIEERHGLEAKLAEALQKQETQRAAYRAARQKREIVARLRETQQGEYRREMDRTEQRMLDEMHLLRRVNRAPDDSVKDPSEEPTE